MNFHCHIEKGKLAIDTPSKWSKYLEGFDEGTKLVMVIDREKNRRSISQNSYYWLYLGVIENETGNTADDLHEYFKRKFLRPQEKTIMGEQIKLPSSTTDLAKHDFGEYLDKISAMTGVPLPDPELAGYTTNYDRI